MSNNERPTCMGWQETNASKTPEQVLSEAIARYQHKFDCAPTRALVPLTFPDLNGSTPAGLVIERHKDVKPGYLWLVIPEPKPQDDQCETETQTAGDAAEMQ